MIDYDAIKMLSEEEANLIRCHFGREVEIYDAEHHFDEAETSSRRLMRAFLKNHFRYDTMNGWNASTSYANNMKIHHLPFPLDVDKSDELWSMMNMDEWQLHLNCIINNFATEEDNQWTVGFNGKSGGYLVLYEMHLDAKNKRVCYPGRSTDMNEDFGTNDWRDDDNDWDSESLAERCRIVQAFDELCAAIAIEYAMWVRAFDIKEEEIMVPKKVPILVAKN